MIKKEILKAYNKERSLIARDKVCHAPFTSLNFEQNGNMTACCFNRVNVLGKYPNQSIAEAWTSKEAKVLRKKIDDYDLSGGCKLCGILLEGGNYNGTKAIHYDEYAHGFQTSVIKKLLGLQPKYYPKVFEFEISNTCNLACNMCSGYYSSTIRTKREKLPAIYNPYDDKFVEQLAEFIPQLTDMKFLGGEPFLIDIYYKIWDKIIAENPKVKIHITTNGTVLNNKVKAILEKLRVGIVMSIDSVDPELFESIRIGAKWDKVYTNFKYFKELTKRKDTYLSIAACAMSNNWREIPDLIRFANKEEVPIHFNVVWNPGHMSLRFLDYDQLSEIEAYFQSQSFSEKSTLEKNNHRVFKELTMTVSQWKEERKFTRLNNMDDFEDFHFENLDVLGQTTNIDSSVKDLLKILLAPLAKKSEELQRVVVDSGLEYADQGVPAREAMFTYWQAVGDYKFTSTFFDSLVYLSTAMFSADRQGSFEDKVKKLKTLVMDLKDQQAVLSDLIDDVDRKSVVNQLKLVDGNSFEDLKLHIKENY